MNFTSYYSLVFFILLLNTNILQGQKRPRPFPKMDLYQEWECEEIWFDPRVQHFQDLIIKSEKSRIIKPAFISAIDSLPIVVDGNQYYRYWPILEDSISFDSLTNIPPFILKDTIKYTLHNSDGIGFYKYFLIREDSGRYFFLLPTFLLAKSMLADSSNEEMEDPYIAEYVIENSNEHLLFDLNPNPESKPDGSGLNILFNKIDTSYYSEEWGEMVYVFGKSGKSSKYNICIKEIRLTKQHGIIGIVLYNRVLDKKAMNQNGKWARFTTNLQLSIEK